MTQRRSNLRLKSRTRLLIAACGGLEESSRACSEECRPYSVAHLSRAQNPQCPDNYLPIDIVDCLEAYCGRPIVTQAMAEARPSGPMSGDLRDEASEVTEAAADLQRRVREALADDGKIDGREGAEIAQAANAAMDQLRDVLAVLQPEGGQ